MSIDSPELLIEGLLEDASNFDLRFIPDYGDLAKVANLLRARGCKIVLTSGSFDILHEGHSMYLEAARDLGDFLIVGVDDDEKIRERKGPNRPAVPQMERLRMVTHQRGVGIVTLKTPKHAKWALIAAVRPDVLVATEDTYSEAQIRELESTHCGRVEVLRRMATISTSARIRLLQFRLAETLSQRIADLMPDLIRRITSELVP